MKTFIWIGLSVIWAAGPVRALPQEKSVPAQNPPALTESVTRAFQLLNEDKMREARTELDRAQKLAAGPCGECLLGMSYIYSSEKDWKRAKEAVNQAIPLLKAPGLVSRGYNQLGTVAYQSKDLDSAEEAFRHAVSTGGAWGTLARYNLAQVLLTRQRWAEAAEMARSYLKDSGPAGPAVKQAHIVLCQARTNLPAEAPRPPLKPDSETQSEIKRVEGEVTRPEILSQPRPVYPLEARKAREQGKVIVEAIIDKEGCVTNVRALQGLPHGLTESAEDAVRHWVFKPATIAGAPVKVYYVLTVNFSLQSDVPSLIMPGVVP